MSQQRFSRQLAGRVEVEFHHHPNKLRRWTWWTAAVLSVLACAWLVQAGLRGEKRLYEAGDVSTPHMMFENDCYRCHIDNWAPLKRLISLDDGIHSVSNAKCIECHVGPAHHDNQVPIHGDASGELSCAKCHREHEGDAQLARVADRHCTDCHNDLQTAPGTPTFAKSVWSFEKEGGHPDFKIEELLAGKIDPNGKIDLNSEGEPIHHAFKVVGYFARPGEKARWQDKAKIRFNHAAHLKAMYNEEGERIDPDEDLGIVRRSGPNKGETIGYPTSCADCHEFDVERRYMKPINYEKHCQECHQLTFDVEKFVEKPDATTGELKKIAVTVPHETPDVVRGYLSKVYTLDTLDGKVPEEPLATDPLAELRLGFPGRDFDGSFSSESARKIFEKLSKEEKELYPLEFVKNEMARRKGQQVLFKENGACALCHDINKFDTKADAAKAGTTEPWEIVKPNIPMRWYKHSWFRHDSHRMLSCIECHYDMSDGHQVYDSTSTGDVLMAGKDLCLKCHRTGPATEISTGDSRLLGARADCVECHGYHDYSKEDFDGNLNLYLTGEGTSSTSTPKGHGSK